MNPRFQADADLHFEIVAGVLRREPSIDFQSAQEALEEGLPDEEVVLRAASENRMVVSHDVTTMPSIFRALMKTQRSLPGLLLIPQFVPVGHAIDDLVLIWSASDADE